MKKYLFIACFLFPCVVFSQYIEGKVTNENNEPLVGASVFWQNTSIGTNTNENGEFELAKTNLNSNLLIVKYVGHTSDTLEIINQSYISITLYSPVLLQALQ